MGSMAEKRIIMAHGLKGEVGVPTDVRQSGLPWARLPHDIEFLKRMSPVLILGKASYDLSERWLNDGERLLLGVSQRYADGVTVFDSLEMAIEAAETERPGAPITIGGGPRLAAAAFELLQSERAGSFYETVVSGIFPSATSFMPRYDIDKWTSPQVLHDYPSSLTRTVTNGQSSHVHIPAYKIQVRHVK